MRIAVLDDYQDAVRGLSCFRLLDGHEVAVLVRAADPEELADVEALVPIRERTRIDEALLARLPRLRLVSQTGRVGPHLDLGACTARGVAVAEGVGAPVATAELTWALVLAGARRLTQYAAALHAGEWQRNGLEDVDGGLGFALEGRTLGILGLGRIGSRVAAFGRAFGMDVLVWGRERSRAAAAEAGFATAASAEDVLARADVASLHLRLSEETRGIVSLAALRTMKPTALLVNTARAALVEPGALAAALEQGRPGAAAVDVFDAEPAVDDTLLQLPNVVATPHVGFVERDAYERMFEAAFRNVLRFAAGDASVVVNPEALDRGER
ncbi:MAG TPA: D-2-hydroxyacid dehydrogenase family protein [Gaiellaceae bacterium]|nr:D-2-hydroxyacid dehydrogenase family protein [Gaiellaceae bacterium]